MGQGESLPRSFAFALGSGTILQGFNSALIAVALVSIAQHFGDSSSLPWLISSMYIAAAVGAPVAGRLCDVFGARRIYLWGLAIVAVATFAGPFLPSTGWLIADRVLLGLGASAQFPAAMALIRRIAAERSASPASALGVIAVCGQTSAALGPALGGLVVAGMGWQGIFWINVPLLLNSAWWVWRVVPADPPRTDRPGIRRTVRDLDPLGMALFVTTLLSLLVFLIESTERMIWPLLLVTIAAAGLFVLRESRARTPFVDVRLLARYPALSLTCMRGMTTFTAFYCVFYGMPVWFEAGRDLGPVMSGLLMFPIFGVGVLGTMAATRMSRRCSPRWLLLIGSAAFLVAGAVMAGVLDASSPIWLLVLVGVLLGIPNGFNNLGNQLVLHESVPTSHAGSVSGVYRTAQFVGANFSAVIVAYTVGTADSGAAAPSLTALGVVVGAIGMALCLGNVVALISARRN
ncbi:MFS transporter [Rhodococcus sp. NPDC047139]|uniref:MFS transporter n=1 Tax=Rhodococcus sp. NPDC047139 TaxID=3155141 RepID=UPI0033D1CC7C